MRAETAVFIPFAVQTQDSRPVCAELTPESPEIAQHRTRCTQNFGPAASMPRHLLRRNAPQTPSPPNLLLFNRGQTRCSLRPRRELHRGQTHCFPPPGSEPLFRSHQSGSDPTAGPPKLHPHSICSSSTGVRPGVPLLNRGQTHC